MKTNVHLSQGVMEETGIDEQVVEAHLHNVRDVKGHEVANVELEGHHYLARHVQGPGVDEWGVDRLRRVYA